jgi:hypothetical protein
MPPSPIAMCCSRKTSLPPSHEGPRIRFKNALRPGMRPVHDARALDMYLCATAAVAVASCNLYARDLRAGMTTPT